MSYIAKSGLILRVTLSLILLLIPNKYWVIGMHHHTWLKTINLDMLIC